MLWKKLEDSLWIQGYFCRYGYSNLGSWKSANSKKVFQWSLKKKKINLRCYNLICIDVAGTVQNQVKNYRDQKISLFSHLN